MFLISLDEISDIESYSGKYEATHAIYDLSTLLYISIKLYT